VRVPIRVIRTCDPACEAFPDAATTLASPAAWTFAVGVRRTSARAARHRFVPTLWSGPDVAADGGVRMKSGDFPAFFRALNGHEAFPWQCRLASALCARQWPQAVHVPTGCGKTSMLDAFVFALAFHQARDFPRRLFYVIDRRLVVDDILGHAQELALKLAHALATPRDYPASLVATARRLAALSVEG